MNKMKFDRNGRNLRLKMINRKYIAASVNYRCYSRSHLAPSPSAPSHLSSGLIGLNWNYVIWLHKCVPHK